MTDVTDAVTIPGSSGRPAIAVLPFANMSADSDQEYFSDGLAEEIINLLAQVPGLKVIARTSAFAFRGDWYQKDIELGRPNAPMIAFAGFLRPLRANPRWPKIARMMNLPDCSNSQPASEGGMI